MLFKRKYEVKDDYSERGDVLCLNPIPTEVYSITKHYAGNDPDERHRLVEAKLEIALDADDWYKFQNQSFYPELIQYLDNLRILIRDRILDMDSDLSVLL